jgi:hypothetical protein
MGDFEFRINVDGKEVIDDVREAIEDGARNGAAEARQQMEDVAKQKIRSNAAIFTGELISSFTKGSGTSPDGELIVWLENDSDHAAPVEYGAEYDEEGPPLRALLPWVYAHLEGDPVQNAFWLQEKIKEEGIDALGFMAAAEDYARANADDDVRRYIELELRSQT